MSRLDQRPDDFRYIHAGQFSGHALSKQADNKRAMYETEHAVVKGKKRHQEGRHGQFNRMGIGPNNHAQNHDGANNQIFQPVQENQVKAFPAPVEHTIYWYRIKEYQRGNKNWLVDSKLHIDFTENQDRKLLLLSCPDLLLCPLLRSRLPSRLVPVLPN